MSSFGPTNDSTVADIQPSPSVDNNETVSNRLGTTEVAFATPGFQNDDNSDAITPPKSPEKEHPLTNTIKKAFHLEHIHATGPSSFFHPTNVHMHVRWLHSDSEEDQQQEHTLLWRARDNRKGRNSIAVTHKTHAPLRSHLPSKAVEVGKNILTMCTTFPYYNMAFWSGWSYAFGSVLFVIDGAFSWGPTAFPGTKFAGEATYGVPLCFFFGAILYQIGATMAYLEAINDGSFQGSALKRMLEGHAEEQKAMLDEKLHTFFGHMAPHHRSTDDTDAPVVDPEAGWKKKDRHERPGSMYSTGDRRGGMDMGPAEEGEVSEYLTWRWWPTWHALRTHHIFEMGYVACAIQLFGATLYGITGVIVLPGILDSFTDGQELGGYWIPQVVASTCFLTAGLMFTLETQQKWHKPEQTAIGWWIGVWATVGSVGFLLCAVFGILSLNHSWAGYQSDLSSMWGSAAYLISSLLQWYEAVNKGPVLAFPNTNNVR